MSDPVSDILESVDELARRGKISRNKAFAAWYAIQFHDVDEDTALESAAADGGNDNGIDLAFIDDTQEEIIVLQAHCPENTDKVTPKNKWDQTVACIPFVLDPSRLKLEGRKDLAESLEKMRQDRPNFRLSIGLVTLGKSSESIRRSVEAHEKSENHSDITFFYFPQEHICDQFRALNADSGVPEDNFNFEAGFISDSGEYGRAFVGSVNADELRRLHDSHKELLFAGNVRLYLGARKGGINEQIKKTAQEDPGLFWALNNGITIVADTATKIDDTSLKLKRFSIVNGCQTTSSLVRAGATSSAKVLVRVIAAKAGLKNEIVRYNNSQNAVKIWTVRAVDDVQEQLRNQFKAAQIDYAPKQSGSRRKRDANTIELDKVAQYLAASHIDYLIQAIDNKSELFDEPYQTLFKRGTQAGSVYLAWLAGGAADEERQQLFEDLNGDNNRALLGVTSVYWIVYCTYRLIEKFSDIKSTAITLPRMKRTEFKSALRKYAKEAASIFWDAAVDTYDHEVYGSIKSTLRSQGFLKKMDSKLASRIARTAKGRLPDLATVAKLLKP